MSAGQKKTSVNRTSDKAVRFDQFQENSISTSAPQGWLLEFLKRQKTGLTGHPEVLSYPFNSCLWAGIIQRVDEKHGSNWWRYEQTAYYSDGLIRLGYLLQDSTLIKTGRAGIDYTLRTVQKNGRLGPDFLTSQWPIAVYYRVLQAEYLATGDQRIIDALHKHYLSFTPEEVGNAKRNIVNIEGMLWTYGKTNDKKLLELAEAAYKIGGFELTMPLCLSQDKLVFHGVTYMEMAKLPAILYTYTGKKEYLDAAINAMKKLDRDHMLPDGVPSSNEFLDGKDPMSSHETCDISDYTWAVGYLLMATGDATWADHIEKAVFNAGPGAVSKDFKNLQYFSSVNQALATGNSNHNKFTHGSTWMAYWPCHETECCAGNVHRFMPNYAARMWMHDKDGGLIAALYGPSVEKFAVKGENISVTESTNYPFSEDIVFTFDMNKSVSLPFTFRIPAWCLTPSVTINGNAYTGALQPGSFVTIKRMFNKNDKVALKLPMPTKLVKCDNWGVSVEHGPLLFAYPIPERITIDTCTYANLGGKRSINPDFLALDVRPAGPWNYALAVDENNFLKNIRIENTGKSAYPFDPKSVSMVIKVPARRVKNWTLQDDRYTPSLPEAGKFECEQKVDTINLVPYGSTRLRISVFPSSINEKH
ncbi:MAG: glycoside hydrolase family 127 protein [Bacteroidales bacterium]|nr:glycoside hydrolase family 127 protein [Bacteroidales bacterium]